MDQCAVLCIHPGDVITVVTTKGQFLAKKLVIAAGPWSPGILKELGLDLSIQVWNLYIYIFKR